MPQQTRRGGTVRKSLSQPRSTEKDTATTRRGLEVVQAESPKDTAYTATGSTAAALGAPVERGNDGTGLQQRADGDSRTLIATRVPLDGENCEPGSEGDSVRAVPQDIRQRFRGTLRSRGDQTLLTSGDLSVEVLTGDVTTDENEVARQRIQTFSAVQRLIGKPVLVYGEQVGNRIFRATVSNRAATVTTPSTPGKRDDFAAVRAVIDRLYAELKKPGVIGVRPGYKFRNGWITNEPAIVAVVTKKKPLQELGASDALPGVVEGITVDVTPATPLEQLAARSPNSFAETISVSASSATEASMASWLFKDDLERAMLEVMRTGHYQAPPDLRLDEVTDAMTVLCHVSPDAGWPTLKDFFGTLQRKATVAMYDFSAPHVLERLRSSAQSSGADLELILDPGLTLGNTDDPNNVKSGDFTEDKVVTSLKRALRSHLDFVWAAVKRAGKTDDSIFPSAYHIKVAVLDSSAFWLSSGNWQSSNQPDIDPLNGDADRTDIFRTYNREWHVIVNHPQLAHLYEQFIEWDISQARPIQAQPEAARLPQLVVPDWAISELMEVDRRPPRYFAPRKLTFQRDNPLRVQPLLTPDNYAQNVLDVIKKARRTLYFQNQYINVGKERSEEFAALLDALIAKKAEGVDVRIILRNLPKSRKMLEDMQNYGFDMSWVRLQSNSHTKGIIVDSQIAVLGSHNWSNEGALYNRDASLIFYNEDVAKYYEDVFLHDWDRLARRQAVFEFGMPTLADGSEAAGINTILYPWSSFYED